ncbi:MAG: sigma-70 family RNA polymerase sigma factor [Oscillospiraceae bacterium]|nr:sigma-70 family RNA polymerase sigma factor [Oscillospiraceae bacterium]
MTKELEAELIASVLAGDADSFEPLVKEHEKKIYNLALRMTGDPDDAYDCAQDAFVKAYTSLKDFRGESAFGSWLYRLASNVCLDFLRREKRRGVVSLTVEDEELDIADLRFSPEDEFERAELRDAINAALMRLPASARQMVVMRDVSGLSYAEIAGQLGLELGTVKSRIARSREKLVRILSEDETFRARAASKKRKEGNAHA